MPDNVLSTERRLPFKASEIFGAFQDPSYLARWWGPAGFSNTFEQFEFRPGGRWLFTMHGPNGIDYPNECAFHELVTDHRVVIDHVVAPRFRLTIGLVPDGDGTRLTWDQAFEDADTAAKLSPICEPANEENLDRLSAVLAQA